MEDVPRLALVLPSDSYRAGELLAAAGRLGAEVVTVSDVRQAFARSRPEAFLEVDLANPSAAAEAIVELDGRLHLDAVLSLDDAGLVAAALAGERLGLVHSAADAVAATRDKVTLRRRLERAGVAQPAYAVVAAGGHVDEAAAAAAEAAVLGYPVVVKPANLSGSRGVIRADDAAGAAAAARRARAVLTAAGEPASTPLLVESFVPGREIALDGLLEQGRLRPLAVFDKPDPLDGPFFEETIYVTPSRLDPARQRAAAGVVAAACAAVGLDEGPVHAELRLAEPGGEPVLIEVAARTVGGRCAKALRFAGGESLDELVIAHALGLPLPAGAADGVLAGGAAGVAMIPIPRSGRLEAVEGLEAARAVPLVTGIELTIPLGRHIEALPEGDRYLGFVFARGDHPASVEAALRSALGALEVRVGPGEPLPAAAVAARC